MRSIEPTLRVRQLVKPYFFLLALKLTNHTGLGLWNNIINKRVRLLKT